MKNEEILQKAIEKAEQHGWNFFGKNEEMGFRWEIDKCVYLIHDELPFLQMYWETNVYANYGANIWEVLFDHDFAKAFWGEKPLNMGIELGTDQGEIVSLENWQYHLQQIVLEPDPIKYLEKFL